MTLKEYIEKRVFVFIITTLVILVILGISFYNVLNNKSGDMVIKDNISYKINTIKSESNNYPMTKEDGELYSSVHKVKVKNKDDKKANFEIVLKDKNSSNLIDKIYYKINDEEVKRVNSNHVLYEGRLDVGKTEEIEVRFWLGSDLLTDEDTDKKTNIYLEVYGK